MTFIKNKTTNQSKLLLTSSVLILNGNMCDLANSRPKPGQQFLKQTTTNSRLIMAKQKDSEIDEILHDLGEVSSKLKKLKKRLPTGNLPIYEGDESGYESDSESESESESESKTEPIYEEINYAKIDPNKNNKQPYKNHTKSHWDEGYSSGSGRANHSDQALKDSIEKSGNNNDSNVHFYETIPPITADEYINGKEKSDVKYEEKGYHQIDGSYNDTKEPIYEDPIDFKNNSQPETSSHTYDSVYEPNNEPTNEATNGFKTNKEATKEIIEDLAFNSDEVDQYIQVHQYIPEIKTYKLIENINEIVGIMNAIARARDGSDNKLTKEQKNKFTKLKTRIEANDSPCNKAIKLYEKIYTSLLNSMVLKEKDKEKWCKKAKEIDKKIKKILEDVEKLRGTISYDIIPFTDL